MFVNYSENHSGFTLIEMAVVLVIVSLLLGSFIGTFAERIETTQRDNTKKELEEIKQVLMAYAFSQVSPRLPCPDTSSPLDGIGDCAAGVNYGFIPWKDLGVGYADAWNVRYRYWANTDFVNGFQLTTDNNKSTTVRTRIGDSETVLVNNAVAVIFSAGKNGWGGITVDEQVIASPPATSDESANINANFMARTPSKQGAAAIGGEFDDILVWINSYEIKAKMVEAGVLP